MLAMVGLPLAISSDDTRVDDVSQGSSRNRRVQSFENGHAKAYLNDPLPSLRPMFLHLQSSDSLSFLTSQKDRQRLKRIEGSTALQGVATELAIT